MHSKIANLKPDLMGEMLVDVVKQLMTLHYGELPLTNHNCAVFMCLFWSPTDVHSLVSTMMRTSILDEQSRRHKRLGIDCKVSHGGLGARKRKGCSSGGVHYGGFFQGGGRGP
jgi:hypothetical protein